MEKDYNGIVINRMFSGEYLRENLGHEVINLYQADNGNHYLYLLDDGEVGQNNKGKVKWMLMIKHIDTAKHKVVALACGLNDDFFDKEENITYGGVNVFDIFKLNKEQGKVCITYKAEKVFIPKKDIIICISDKCEFNDTTIHIRKEPRNTSRLYFMQTDEEYQEEYQHLLKLINVENNDLWEKYEKKVEIYKGKNKKEKIEIIEEATKKIFEGRIALFNNVEQKQK